ncbi:MAG TPA: ATPase [Coxiellaceae bacterium]|nr:ATPase [Coxiellaceae bacterium]
MYITRALEGFVKKATKQFPILLITGARQVGKTTFLKHLCEKNMGYVTLDDPLILNLAKNDPALFLQRFHPPILIDEIQYAPELLPYIKIEVDKKQLKGIFWLTGSQQFHLMKGISESLAGRVGIIQLLGMSKREMIDQNYTAHPFIPTPSEINSRLKTSDKFELKELYQTIWRGSYPAIALNNETNHDLFYGSYVQTYLQRDVRYLAKVGDETTFLNFLRAVAARSGQMLNISELAKDISISPNTAKNWLSILEASGIIYLLEPYHNNITKRLIKAPKLYMLDTGLCSYLTAWSSPETLEAGAMSGAILETWILGELLKSYTHNGIKAPFYYYRDKDQKEIDLLIIKDGTIFPLEFKKTASPNKNDVKHFQVLEKLNMPIGDGGIICLTKQSLPLAPKITTIPIGAV